MSTELVSIIIPSYNRELVIRQTLESVLNQTYKNWECIIVDDWSSDSTAQVIKRYLARDNRFRLFKRPSDRQKGANACRNFGFKMAKGEYIQWFDADDILFPTMLEEKLNFIENTYNDFVVCEGLIFRDHISNIVGKWDSLESENPLIDQAFGIINFQTNAPLFRKSFLNNKRLFDETLQRKQDYECFSRFLSFRPNYSILKKPLFFYREHTDSISGKDSVKTLSSRIRADFSVYRNLKNSNYSMDQKRIQSHFCSKLKFKAIVALKSNSIPDFLLASFYTLKIISIKFIFIKIKSRFIKC